MTAAAATAPARHAAWIGLGANLGDAAHTLLSAMSEIETLPGVRGVARSSLYRSAALDAEGPDYINAVMLVDTRLDAAGLLHELQAIESRNGRERPYRNAPRTLDLDLLLHDAAPAPTPALTVPHARLHERAFVLAPMTEVCTRLGLSVALPGRGRLDALLRAVSGQRVERLSP